LRRIGPERGWLVGRYGRVFTDCSGVRRHHQGRRRSFSNSVDRSRLVWLFQRLRRWNSGPAFSAGTASRLASRAISARHRDLRYGNGSLKVRYHIIDEGAFSGTDLAGRDTLAALQFRLENCREADQVIALVDAIIEWFYRHDGFDALRPMFAALAGQVVAMTASAAPSVQVSENLLEVRAMLATHAAEWKQQWRQEGQQEGKAARLLRLLEHRIGPVPDEAQGRIATADLPNLEKWIMRIWDAVSVDDALS
jgi:hypothetical protein